MSDRPLSEKSPYSPLRIHTFDWDEVNGDTYVHESEIVALEAERDRLKLRLTEALMYAERGAPLRVTDILRAALEEGGDDE